ncbi:MAG: tRNA (adenosine(37)-N6)-dimethylallyltransferase MiaA [Lachnospiraceae bacterium]|nr:tRNA (adenosine(37)-N6)-dimethylallyltransferase MiaA [Lachnospiraceae bacterium]
MKQPLVILSGPTAVGKTKLSIALAKRIGGEIISADSMQVYKYMDIGTAKIMPEEMNGVKHYLIDCLTPDQEFNVTVFQRMAREAIEQILRNGHIPIVVGGTGFYIQALLKGVEFDSEEESDGYRKQLEDTAAMPDGAAILHDMLKSCDPDSAEAIPSGNVKRVIRALEFYHIHGYTISEHNKANAARVPDYNYAYFVLTRDRADLYADIERRVDLMMEAGLLDEVKRIVELGYGKCAVSMQGLGYKQILAHLRGECTLEEAVYRIKLETRHFAKRQMTWFRRENDVILLDKSKQSEEEILKDMLTVLEDKGIVTGVS